MSVPSTWCKATKAKVLSFWTLPKSQLHDAKSRPCMEAASGIDLYIYIYMNLSSWRYQTKWFGAPMQSYNPQFCMDTAKELQRTLLKFEHFLRAVHFNTRFILSNLWKYIRGIGSESINLDHLWTIWRAWRATKKIPLASKERRHAHCQSSENRLDQITIIDV